MLSMNFTSIPKIKNNQKRLFSNHIVQTKWVLYIFKAVDE